MAAKGHWVKIDAMIKEQRKVAEIRKFLETIYNNGAGRTEDLKSWRWRHPGVGGQPGWRCTDGDAGV